MVKLSSGIIPEESASIYYTYESMEVAARTIAHQWFGTIVSPSWWSHVWLTEGLAAYFADYVIDKVRNVVFTKNNIDLARNFTYV